MGLLGRFGLFSVLALSLVGSIACSTSDNWAEEQATTEAPLTERDWGRAISYLNGLDYLPWGYTDDGCYARAIYYTMNLAAEGISANHVYIIARDDQHGLGSTGRWRYHVAPLVSRDATNELVVLDPVYSRSPLGLRDWYDRQSNWEGTPNAPILKVAPGTTYGDRSGTEVPDPRNASTSAFREPVAFANMPSFDMSKVNAACSIMHSYIDRDTTTNADQKAAKHHALSRDTKRLVTSLVDLRKLGSASGLDASCIAHAPELASCPADTRANNPGSTECCLASAFWCQQGGTCHSPGTALGDGRICNTGGFFSHPAGSGSGSGSSTPNVTGNTCPTDSASTNPGSQACCLASRHWCWSSSGGFCAAPGTQRTVSGINYTCGPNGEWTQ
jgi:hypothetical protein